MEKDNGQAESGSPDAVKRRRYIKQIGENAKERNREMGAIFCVR